MAQLVAHFIGNEEVAGSNPAGSTFGCLAQLVRAIALHAIGRRFESYSTHHNLSDFIFLHTSVEKIVCYT